MYAACHRRATVSKPVTPVLDPPEVCSCDIEDDDVLLGHLRGCPRQDALAILLCRRASNAELISEERGCDEGPLSWKVLCQSLELELGC